MKRVYARILLVGLVKLLNFCCQRWDFHAWMDSGKEPER